MGSNYDDIINLPHHVSANRPQMSMLERAAQFSPFAALTGHDELIRETERLTNKKVEADKDEFNEDEFNMELNCQEHESNE